MKTTPFDTKMFESIKSSLNKQSENNSVNFKDVLRTEPGNTYIVRLLPNTKSPDKTFFHYYNYGWNSFMNGKLIYFPSPATWGQSDLVAEERYRILRTGTEEDKKKVAALTRREYWMVNVYVITDPVNPENNGQVKVLRFGRQLHKIIMDAINGDEADDFGSRVFDISPKGCNFRIKVERQGEYPTYVSSKFTSPREIDDLSEDKYEEIYDSIHDLESFVTPRSNSEIKELLDIHYHCKSAESDREYEEEPIKVIENKPKITESEGAGKQAATASVDDDVVDESIEMLLKGLE